MKKTVLPVVAALSALALSGQQTPSTPSPQSNCGSQTGNDLSKHARLSSKTKSKIARWLHDKGIADINPDDLDPGQIAKSKSKPCSAVPATPAIPQNPSVPVTSKQ